VRLRLRPPRLPEALASMAFTREGDIFKLALNHHGELETVLCALREGGIAVEELDLSKPDLEDVFLELMGRT